MSKEKKPFVPLAGQVSVQRDFYTMATADGNTAEITMYGDIVERQPTDWWTGEPIEGQYIIESEFLEDLKAVENCSDITIRMNSLGGDAAVSILIHNRLRELANNGAHLTCIVDGVAMSGGSLIMCACDTVKVNASSLVMIHKCWSSLFGGYNADQLRKMADSNDAYDNAQVAVYKRKCGLSDTVLLHMMSDTTYMTGAEAKDKGFADELLEDAEPVDIAASADKRTLFVRGRAIHLASGQTPDFIPTMANAGAAEPAVANKNEPETPAKEEHPMASNIEELRAEYPDLTSQIQAASASSAVKAEQQRIRDIDEVAGLFDDEMVREAKYGENPCTAQELTYRAAQAAAKQGRNFLNGMAADNAASGAAEVPAASAATDEKEIDVKDMTPEQRMAAARAAVAETLNKEDK